MERDQAKKIIEALLYMTDHALSEQDIIGVLEVKQFSVEDIKAIVGEISAQYDASGSPIKVVEVAGGWQMATRPEVASYIRKLYKERLTVRLSPSSLETLAIIAYKQPITRGDIEQIRGVEATGVMDTLLERRLVKVVGRKEAIGRPLLYGTTGEFLRYCGLRHLADLPNLDALVAAAPAPTETPAETAEPTLENGELELAGVVAETTPAPENISSEPAPTDGASPAEETSSGEDKGDTNA